MGWIPFVFSFRFFAYCPMKSNEGNPYLPSGPVFGGGNPVVLPRLKREPFDANDSVIKDPVVEGAVPRRGEVKR
jgi:hypothetical protein